MSEESKIDVTFAHKIAKVCHEANRAYCESLGDKSQASWLVAPQWQRDSAVQGVQFHLANPDANAADSHDNWLRDKIAEGWKLGPIKDANRKEHPCMVPYDNLPIEQKRKDHLFKAIVHALTQK